MAAIKDGRPVTDVKKYSNFASTVSSHGGVSLDITKLADPTIQELPAADCVEDIKPNIELVETATKPVKQPPTPTQQTNPSPPSSSAASQVPPAPLRPLTIPAKPVGSVSSTSPPLATSQTPPDYAEDRYPPNMVRMSAVVSVSGIAIRLVAPAYLQYTYSCELFLITYLLWRQTTPRSRCQRRTRVNLSPFSCLWRKQPQKSTPDRGNFSLWRSTSLVPRRKA